MFARLHTFTAVFFWVCEQWDDVDYQAITSSRFAIHCAFIAQHCALLTAKTGRRKDSPSQVWNRIRDMKGDQMYVFGLMSIT
jgi:hypothetical protein